MGVLSKLLAGSLLAHGAYASPLVGALECLAVGVIVNDLNLIPTATPFCSSFLGIKTSTVYTTTTTTLPVVTTTRTSTVATVTTTPPPVTVTATSTSTFSSCSPTPVGGGIRKRQATIGLPAPIASFNSAQISTACSCLRIPTPTSTVTQTATSSPTSTVVTSVTATSTATPSTVTSTTSTTTTVAACPTPPMCGNGGLQYGVFNNPAGRDVAPNYPQFDPTYLKAANNGARYYIYNDTVNPPGDLRGSCSGTFDFYGSTQQVPCQFFTIDHRGYFFAPTAGTYNFSLPNIDDIALLWTGPIAQQGWTRGNADLVSTFTGRAGANSFSVTLAQGQYLPLRIVYADAQSNYGFDFAVTDPYGDVIINAAMSGDPSPYLVQYSCDGTTAPQFAGAFGSEP